MKKNSLTFSLLSCIFLFSCASIMSTSKQLVNFSSNPQSAKVYVDKINVGITPVSTSLLRKNEHSIRIELDGYQTYETQITKKINGWFFGNILFGGLIGIIVDASTGAMYSLTPEHVKATLNAKGVSYLNDGNQIFIAVEMQPDSPHFIPENKIGQLQK